MTSSHPPRKAVLAHRDPAAQRFVAIWISVSLPLGASVACDSKKDEHVPIAADASFSAHATPQSTPVIMSGVALEHAAESRDESGRPWIVTFHQLGNEEEPKDLGTWSPTSAFVAAALPSEANTWSKIGPGDRVTVQCEFRNHVRMLWRCKLTDFKHSSYDLSAVPRVLPALGFAPSEQPRLGTHD